MGERGAREGQGMGIRIQAKVGKRDSEAVDISERGILAGCVLGLSPWKQSLRQVFSACD